MREFPERKSSDKKKKLAAETKTAETPTDVASVFTTVNELIIIKMKNCNHLDRLSLARHFVVHQRGEVTRSLCCTVCAHSTKKTRP